MKISFEKTAQLLEGVQRVISAVPQRTTLPVLTNILLEAQEGHGLRIGATDLDMSIVTRIPAQVEEPGAIALPARKLAEILRELPQTALRLRAEPSRMSIYCAEGAYRFSGMTAEGFPQLPKVSEIAGLAVSYEVLSRLIDKTLFAVSTDETRPVLNGVFWKIDQQGMEMVATDGHRLAKIRVKQPGWTENPVAIIVPPKVLQNLIRLQPREEGTLQITIGEDHLLLNMGETLLFSRLIEGPYPDYERVIPRHNNKKMVIERESLVAGVRRAAVLTNTSRQVRFRLTTDRLELSASSQDIGGEAKERLVAEYRSDDLEMGFDYKYILDALNHIDSEKVAFDLDTPVRPGILYPVPQREGENCLGLVMPLRLGE